MHEEPRKLTTDHGANKPSDTMKRSGESSDALIRAELLRFARYKKERDAGNGSWSPAFIRRTIASISSKFSYEKYTKLR